jgi:hypothetical protein
MFARYAEVTLKDNRHWTARPVWIVMDSRVHEGRLQYLLKGLNLVEVQPEWVDADQVDGPAEEEDLDIPTDVDAFYERMEAMS